MRVCIVQDRTGAWFVRRVAHSEYNLTRDETRYNCDLHISGPHKSLADVPQVTAQMMRARIAAKRKR